MEKMIDTFSEYVGKQITEISPIDSGIDSRAYRLVTSDENLIVRVGAMRQNYDVESALLKLLLSKGMKVPEPVLEGQLPDGSQFAIQKELPGVGLEHMPPTIWSKIIEDVGKQMAIAYSIPVSGFGNLSVEEYHKSGKLVGANSSWRQVIEEYYNYRTNGLIAKVEEDRQNNFNRSFLKEEVREKVLQVVDMLPAMRKKIFSNLKDVPQAVVLHGDLHFEHFLVNGNDFSGIIDWNHTSVGDPLFDAAYMSTMPHGALCPLFVKASGVAMDEEMFGLYRLIISVGKIHTRYVRKAYLNDYPEVLDIALQEMAK